MDSMGIPPEFSTESVQAILYMVPVLITVLMPHVTKWLNKLVLVDNIPTNFVTAGLAVLLTLGFKYLLAPELAFDQVLALVSMMGFGATLFARIMPPKYSGRSSKP